ncbi:hypothetical protein AFA91_23230 [Mycolicibacterium goodii]|uniref:Uncharacterized protein n=1 Tax=Mycolicibacterium goodii TaxID=134601 RepID=A0A0K0XAA5_MYCGD|nr:hypothetical protein AFA91_23230 [Mycolicibacterium goodii]
MEDLPTPEQVFDIPRLGRKQILTCAIGPSLIALGVSIGGGEWILGPLCPITLCPSASRKNVLPVPAGPQTTRFSRRCTHSRVRSGCWVGSGIDEAAGSQTSKVFPVGNPAALRRAASMERARPAASSVSSALMTSVGAQR